MDSSRKVTVKENPSFHSTAAWCECRKGFHCDGWLFHQHEFLRSRWLPEAGSEFHNRKTSLQQSSNRLETYSEWYQIVWQYSERGLTYPKDRLPALSGLAQKLTEYLGDDQYLAGLWKNDLHRGLMWTPMWKFGDTKVAETYQAPSWSWGSVEGGVYWPYIGYGRPTCRSHIRIRQTEVSGQGAALTGQITDRRTVLSKAHLYSDCTVARAPGSNPMR